MKKIKSLYVRDKENPRLVTREVEPECDWVLKGEGIATAKWDGTACLIRDGALYRRHQLRPGKVTPAGWLHWDFDPAADSGHGWAPVTESASDAYHREAFAALKRQPIEIGGTYELCGPKIQGNPHGLESHRLVRHGDGPITLAAPTGFDELSEWLRDWKFEGLVWHHPDGRMAKIKRRDFGHPWPIRE